MRHYHDNMHSNCHVFVMHQNQYTWYISTKNNELIWNDDYIKIDYIKVEIKEQYQLLITLINLNNKIIAIELKFRSKCFLDN